MISGVDHVVILVEDIAAGTAAYRALLGLAPAWQSTRDGAETVLFTLANSSVELMAPAGAGPTADRIRAVLAAQGEGLASLCFKVADIAATHRRLERLGLQPDAVATVASRDSLSGATLSWQSTRAAAALAGGVRLFFLELAGARPASASIAVAPIVGLDHVVISTADPEAAAALYGARLGLDMALDRSHPDGGRLMFFRCGDLIVEVAHRADKTPEKSRDRLYGVSWRVGDLDATRTRLIESGLEVSEIRPGRKSGTRVLTLRSGSCGIPTLLVQPSPPRPQAAAVTKP
ncbi:MAG TPA: VOC family protein [Rhodopseudomonas sp.]|uniref:VOC family protein n=1 Tax=Rhodopseudomonas sp. TaxID=1078 RepID=UPI002EDAECA4